MPLNVANWTDKQLDELTDMLRTADFSAVAAFITENFLATGSRIMTDLNHTTLRVAVYATDNRAVTVSPGCFVHQGKVSQLDQTEIVNILATTVGRWGTGKAAHPTLNRWSIICVKNAEALHSPQDRWFVDDSVTPNLYYRQEVNTQINKAYYDIVVVHGTDATVPTVPAPPTGYMVIAEIYVPAGATAIQQTNIYDTADTRGSQRVPPNWSPGTRILRLEFFASLLSAVKFDVDHDPLTGFHKLGAWHIGSGIVGSTVTAAALNRLTNGSLLAQGELHTHQLGDIGVLLYRAYRAEAYAAQYNNWSDIPGVNISFTLATTRQYLAIFTCVPYGFNVSARFMLNSQILGVEGYHTWSGSLAAGSYTLKMQIITGNPYGGGVTHSLLNLLII